MLLIKFAFILLMLHVLYKFARVLLSMHAIYKFASVLLRLHSVYNFVRILKYEVCTLLKVCMLSIKFARVLLLK